MWLEVLNMVILSSVVVICTTRLLGGFQWRCRSQGHTLCRLMSDLWLFRGVCLFQSFSLPSCTFKWPTTNSALFSEPSSISTVPFRAKTFAPKDSLQLLKVVRTQRSLPSTKKHAGLRRWHAKYIQILTPCNRHLPPFSASISRLIKQYRRLPACELYLRRHPWASSSPPAAKMTSKSLRAVNSIEMRTFTCYQWVEFQRHSTWRVECVLQ